ncbi:hypothetical protein DRH29_05825 [candidate division Kazan bacterium]|uniref:Major facilitator superfamily (MFS) profile domain-containing protein n=1 Tax=candidate division Kazan bacterium TaxID=2202143 RepID=A0A420ZAY3_UNCK3|nr:MAG: hypothetical protein DRH29_05825 [candidate division Kazan bacterium]
MNKKLILLTIANFMGGLGWSIYFSLSRPYYTDFLNASYSMVLIIASCEWLPGLTSFIWGYLSDRYGIKRVLIFGVLAYVISLVGIVELEFIPIIVALASLGWAAAWPTILAGISRISGEYIGRRYGFFALGGSIGWGLGGIVAGLMASYTNIRLTLILSGILAGLAYTLSYFVLGKYEWKYTPVRIAYILKGVLGYVALTCIILTLGMEYALNLISVKLYYEVNENILLYGLAITSLPSFTGAIVRPIAGAIADKLGGVKTVLVAIIMYSLVYLLASFLRGYTLVLLWIIPIYPFYDTGFIRLASEVSGKDRRGLAMGLINTSMSIAGSAVSVFGPLTDVLGYTYSMMIASAIALTSIIPLLIVYRITRSKIMK